MPPSVLWHSGKPPRTMAVSSPGLRQCRWNPGKGKRFKFHDVGPACQRFGNVLHQGELLRASKQELSFACTVGILGHLEVPEQAGRILDLINENGRRMTLEKSVRFLFSLLSLGGEVEVYKRMYREQAQKSRGFAGLSGSGQHDRRAASSRSVAVGFNSTRNPYMQNIQWNRIFCITVRLSPEHNLSRAV